MAILTKSLAKTASNQHLLPWLVCLSGGLLFFYEFIQMNAFGSLNTPVMQTFHLSAGQMSLLSSMYFYANALFLFIAGNLLDRFSTRKLILIAMLLCTFGTLGFAISNSVIEAAVFRFAVGLGGAFCFLSGVRLSSRWFHPSRMALMTGLLVTMAMIGGWVAQAPFSALIECIGWRDGMLLNGLLGIIITVWIWLVVQDRPFGQEDVAETDKSRLKSLGLWTAIQKVLKNAQNWKAAFYTCLMNLPIFLLGALWGSMYLVQIHGYTKTEATSVTGMIFFGTIFGSPLMGWMSDRLGNRRKPMIICAAISLLLMLFVIYDQHLSYFSLLVIFFLLGLITSSQVISYPVVAESNPHVVTASAVSIVSMVTVFGGALMQPISGWLLDLYWKGHYCDGVHCYSLSAYQHAMWILLISFAIAVGLAWVIKETFCRPYEGYRQNNQQ